MNRGDKLLFQSGAEYEVVRAEDGNARVTRLADGKQFALREESELKENVRKLAGHIRMSEYILMPCDWVERKGKFYYTVLPLEDESLSLNRYLADTKQFKNVPFSRICDIMVNIVDNFQIMHYYNLVYSTVTDENIFINLQDSQVRFDGCANFVKNGSLPVEERNTEYYRGPVYKERNEGDDFYALSVMLFKIMYLASPVAADGDYVFSRERLEQSESAASAYLYRQLYPSYINDLFDRIFEEHQVVSEVEFKENIIKLKYSICVCGEASCRAENFFESGKAKKCWKCGKALHPVILKLTNGTRNAVVLSKGLRISQNDVYLNGVFNSFVGEVVENPKKRGVFGIKNVEGKTQYFAKKDGVRRELNANEAAPIAEYVKVVYNEPENVFGEILVGGRNDNQNLVIAEKPQEKEKETGGELQLYTGGESVSIFMCDKFLLERGKDSEEDLI